MKRIETGAADCLCYREPCGRFVPLSLLFFALPIAVPWGAIAYAGIESYLQAVGKEAGGIAILVMLLMSGYYLFSFGRKYTRVGSTIDRRAGTLGLSGTLVPAYRLNSIIGSIPLIGNLLVGGEGGGIFAANFRAAGTFADPKVAVNPLSALAPGALRELFLFRPRNPAPPPATADR